MSTQQSCASRCESPVPPELESVGRCVTHFISSVDQTCAQMHREIVLRRIDVERRAEVASYISESCQLLARVGSNLPLTDELKRRLLTTFLCLMNLRETLDRVCSARSVAKPYSGSPAVVNSAVAVG